MRLAEQLHRRRAEDELDDGALDAQKLSAGLVSLRLRLFSFPLLQHVGARRRHVQILEDGLRVQEARIDLRVFEAPADDENFGRLIATRLWLRRLDVREELFEHVQQRVVVLRAERFRHEAAAGLQEVDRQPERENGQLVLPVRVL